MSFWGAILLPDKVLVFGDRRIVDPEHKYRFRNSTKWRLIGARAAFFGAGSTAMSDKMGDLLTEYIDGKVFHFWDLLDHQTDFREKMSSYWETVKPIVEEGLRKLGAGVPGNDCIIGAVDPAGRPFLVNITDIFNFGFELITEPYRFTTSPIDGKMKKFVGGEIRKFLDRVSHGELPIDVLAQIVCYVGNDDMPYTSILSDLLIVERKEIRLFQSRFFRPWRYKEAVLRKATYK